MSSPREGQPMFDDGEDDILVPEELPEQVENDDETGFFAHEEVRQEIVETLTEDDVVEDDNES